MTSYTKEYTDETRRKSLMASRIADMVDAGYPHDYAVNVVLNNANQVAHSVRVAAKNRIREIETMDWEVVNAT